MFYRNGIKTPGRRQALLELTGFAAGMGSETDENILPYKYAGLAYNYSTNSGALCDGLSALPLTFDGGSDAGVIAGEDILRVWHYRRYDFAERRKDDRLLAYTKSKKIYQMRLYSGAAEGFTELNGAYFNVIPDAINYRLNGDDVIILCSGEENMMVWDGDNYPYYVASSPFIVSMDIHYERLFAVVGGEQNSLWFSDDLDPTNWDLSLDGAGFIEMVDERGRMLKVISFLDYVYVFREFGISRVSAYADQENFAVSQLFVSSGRIAGNTISVCGDRIIFLAEDGLYAFDGLSARAVLPNLRSMLKRVDKSAASAVYHGGKYYLSCALDFGGDITTGCEGFNGGYTNNALIELDVRTMQCNIHRGLDIYQLACIRLDGRSVIAAAVNADGKCRLCEIGRGENITGRLVRLWVTPFSDLNSPKKKLIKEVTLHTEKDMTLRLETENSVQDITVKGGGLRKARVNISGRLFRAAFITSENGVRIVSPRIRFDILER